MRPEFTAMALPWICFEAGQGMGWLGDGVPCQIWWNILGGTYPIFRPTQKKQFEELQNRNLVEPVCVTLNSLHSNRIRPSLSLEYLASGPWLIIGRETSWAIGIHFGGFEYHLSSFNGAMEDPTFFVVDHLKIGQKALIESWKPMKKWIYKMI